MKKTVLLAVTLTAALKLGEIKASAWFKKTHTNIIEQALEILKNDGKAQAVKELEEYSKELVHGACIPDVKGDWDNGWGLHYYSPKNKFGLPNRKNGIYYPNRLGSFSKSAGTMLEENYTTALIFTQNKKYSEAAVLLGRAVHFLSDICCTPHSTSKVCNGFPQNPHMAFEKTASRYTGIFNSMTAKTLYKSYLTLSPVEIANKLAKISSSFYEKLDNVSQSDFESVIASTLPLSQSAAAALLYKFVTESKEDALIDADKFYTIRNCESGLFLHHDGSLSESFEEFRILFNSDGWVYFYDSRGRPLTIGRNNSKFRLALKDKNLLSYRLTCSKKFSKTVGELPIIKRAAPVYFKPENDSQYWVIRKS